MPLSVMKRVVDKFLNFVGSPLFHKQHMMAKGKVVPVQAVKAYKGSRGTSPFILNLGHRWK
jgi:hypothetical protein